MSGPNAVAQSRRYCCSAHDAEGKMATAQDLGKGDLVLWTYKTAPQMNA